jgi:hypothetical protein
MVLHPFRVTILLHCSHHSRLPSTPSLPLASVLTMMYVPVLVLQRARKLARLQLALASRLIFRQVSRGQLAIVFQLRLHSLIPTRPRITRTFLASLVTCF